MGWINNIFKKRETEINEESIEDVLLRALIKNGDIDRDSAMAIPIVSSCVDLVCNTFASIPFKLYKQSVNEDGKRITTEVNDERVNLINDDTRDTLDGFQFKKALCEDYLLGKGGYAFIKKTRNNVKGLFYVKDNQVTIVKNDNPIYKRYDLIVGTDTYKDYQFIKLLRNSKDGSSGKGVTSQIARALLTGYERLKYEYDLTVTGGSRKGFIKSQKHLDEKGIKALKEAWEQYYSGNANTVILNDGMEFQEASNNSQQNEINSKNLTFNQEIRDVFHVSDDSSKFIKDCITPIAIAFTTALNRDLLLESEKEEYYFAYDLSELSKGTLLERYNAYSVAIQNGFKTRNEIRYLENDDALKGLDSINLGLGSVLLDTKTGNIYTPNTNQTVNIDREEVKNDGNGN